MNKTRRLIYLAFLVSLGITLERVLGITAGPFRISLGNLPIVLAGILFGPLDGALVGMVSDLLGCFIAGWTVNPVITFGAAVVGFTAGVVFRVFSPKCNERLGFVFAIFSAHILGNIVIKSIGLHILLGYPWALLVYRVPLYLLIAVVETPLVKIICVALRHRHT